MQNQLKMHEMKTRVMSATLIVRTAIQALHFLIFLCLYWLWHELISHIPKSLLCKQNISTLLYLQFPLHSRILVCLLHPFVNKLKTHSDISNHRRFTVDKFLKQGKCKPLRRGWKGGGGI